jgi:uncharacterized protein YwbE
MSSTVTSKIQGGEMTQKNQKQKQKTSKIQQYIMSENPTRSSISAHGVRIWNIYNNENKQSFPNNAS